jgi:hypothetical protein
MQIERSLNPAKADGTHLLDPKYKFVAELFQCKMMHTASRQQGIDTKSPVESGKSGPLCHRENPV